MYYVIDIETDGLLSELTLIHVLSYTILDEKFNELTSDSIIDYQEMRELLIDIEENKDTIIGHYFWQYDAIALEIVLGVKMANMVIIDTLAVSNNLFAATGFKNGLYDWGERLGIEKPKVKDWVTLDVEVYKDRCREDVKINTKLFLHLMNILFKLHKNIESSLSQMRYSSFIMKCSYDKYHRPLKIDKKKCMKHILELEKSLEKRKEALNDAMPPQIHKSRPKKARKKDGSLSVKGEQWLQELRALNLDLQSEHIYKKGNCQSVVQLKDWLYSLGWDPITFNKSKSTGNMVPQIYVKVGEKSILCSSIKKLIPDTPVLSNLKGLGQDKHRLGVLKGFLDAWDEDGYVYSSTSGLTNTMRERHSAPIVNLPRPSSYYGEEIRGCIIVPDDRYKMSGYDFKAIEDMCKQHYIAFYEPEYVEEMQQPGFDPHLDLGIQAEIITERESIGYKKVKKYLKSKKKISDKNYKIYTDIDNRRTNSKTVNFSVTYGIGVTALGKLLGDRKLAERLMKVYWERNKAIKQIEKDCDVVEVMGNLYLYNPVAKMYYFLKNRKDIFSTLNQGTASYVFFLWVFMAKQELKSIDVDISLTYHDEILVYYFKELEDEVERLLQKAVDRLNDHLKLNILLKIDGKSSYSYAGCH